MKTACAYIRVSTDKQEELSPNAQKRLILDYCKKNNYKITDEYLFIENGISGKKAEKRPQFQKMIHMAKSKEHPFDIILVWKFSRFARNQEESIVYKSLLKKSNVEVISISEPLIEGPFGSLIERIIEWMDEYYSIRLSGEVMRGMSEKALHGGYQSALPYGYRYDKNHSCPQIYEPEAKVVTIIFNLYNEGKSFLEIARYLNLLGYKTKRGAAFEHRTIRYILENPFYKGYVRWNRQRHDDHTIKEQSEWIIAKGQHQAIISESFFDQTQEQLHRRTLSYKAKSAGSMTHWLSGIIKCSSCGASLVAKNKRYYQCGKYNKGACLDSHFVSIQTLENTILDAFKNILDCDKFTFVPNSTYKTAESSIQLLTIQLQKIKDKEQRIKQAYRDGIDSLEEYKENKLLLSKEQDALTTALQKTNENTDISIVNEIHSVYDIINDKTLDNTVRANALRSVVDHMVYDKKKDTLKIFFYL